MTVIHPADRRRVETPNGIMSTLATPTQGDTRDLAVWHVDMTPGRRGPLHAFDRETVWTLLTGAVTLDLEGEKIDLAAGDTVIIPADKPGR
jgi:quercetin dioxygenase-like cupin family protein